MELLVAMTVFSIVMMAVYTAFNTGAQVWRRGERDMQMFRDARVVLTVMSKELRCAFPEAGHLFYGEDDRSGEKDTDRIEFFTVRPPFEPGQGVEPRILKVAYYLDPARGGHGYVLKREEQIVLGRIPAEAEMAGEKGAKERVKIKMEKAWECVIASRATSLDFQYSWGDQWFPLCEKGFGLPASVRIALTLQGEGKRPEARRFETAVYILLGHGEGPRLEEPR